MHASSALAFTGRLVHVAAFMLDYCAIDDEFELRLRSGSGGAVACCGLCLADELSKNSIYDCCIP